MLRFFKALGVMGRSDKAKRRSFKRPTDGVYLRT